VFFRIRVNLRNSWTKKFLSLFIFYSRKAMGGTTPWQASIFFRSNTAILGTKTTNDNVLL